MSVSCTGMNLRFSASTSRCYFCNSSHLNRWQLHSPKLHAPKSLDNDLTFWSLFLLPYPGTSNNFMFAVYLDSDHFSPPWLLPYLLASSFSPWNSHGSWSNNAIILFKIPLCSIFVRKSSRALSVLQGPYITFAFLLIPWVSPALRPLYMLLVLSAMLYFPGSDPQSPGL